VRRLSGSTQRSTSCARCWFAARSKTRMRTRPWAIRDDCSFSGGPREAGERAGRPDAGHRSGSRRGVLARVAPCGARRVGAVSSAGLALSAYFPTQTLGLHPAIDQCLRMPGDPIKHTNQDAPMGHADDFGVRAGEFGAHADDALIEVEAAQPDHSFADRPCSSHRLPSFLLCGSHACVGSGTSIHAGSLLGVVIGSALSRIHVILPSTSVPHMRAQKSAPSHRLLTACVNG
jgi:hypothetical protein